MLSLVARFGEHTLRFALPAGEALLGFSSENEIPLPFPGVSRVHARVTRSGRDLVVEDLGSKNGVLVGGERVPRAVLERGASLRIGQAVLTLEDVSTSDVEMALRLDVEPRRGGDASSGGDALVPEVGQERGSPAEAFRVVREIERSSHRKFVLHRQDWLERIRLALGADYIVLFHRIGSGEIALEAFDGIEASFPFEELLGRARDGLLRLDGRTALVPRRDLGDVIVAAVLEESDPADWKREFFEYAAGKLVAEEDTGGDPPENALRQDEDVLKFGPDMVLGDSPAIRNLVSQLQATVGSRMDILLLGETGTGKELFARMIHASGPTAGGPFVAINCAAIPSELLEAELFGVQARVATGVDPRPGLFLQADGGSIFLDEVGELAESLQAKLLRVLQEREVLPLGASTPRKINVRVISASNRDLFERTNEGRFRRDLYYRLRALQFHLPPLRDRSEDIPALVLSFVRRASQEYGKQIRGVSRKALNLMCQHDWPGNIRELESEVKRAVLVCPSGGALQKELFGPIRWRVERAGLQPQTTPSVPAEPTSPESLKLQELTDSAERAAITRALEISKGNQTVAAKMLGITRNGLAMKMARLSLRGRS